MHFFKGDLDEQHADDDDDDNFKTESAQPVSDTFLRTCPRVVSKVAIGTSSVCSVVEGRVRTCKCSKKDGISALPKIFGI